MLLLQGVTYVHPNKDVLFSDIDLTIYRRDKVALIGNNGTGKSTLLKIMAGELLPSGGSRRAEAWPYYLPQLLGPMSDLSIAQALGIADKIDALNQILSGNVTGSNLELLDDDWEIENRCQEAFQLWKLDGLDLEQPMSALSGGEKTKLFLAGIAITRPEIVLLDEPSNHLDATGREILYSYLRSTNDTLVVVSHDRTLLNLLGRVCELRSRKIFFYGGNYEFYVTQKQIGDNALAQEIKDREKDLRKAKEAARETIERQQKLDARGKAKQEKAGLPTIAMKTFKNNAEKSTARLKEMHAGKVGTIADDLRELRRELPDPDKMKMGLDNSGLHNGKVLVTVDRVNCMVRDRWLWSSALSFEIRSGERVAIRGANGVGKTTLIRLVLDQQKPDSGIIQLAEMKAIYIDQDYGLIDGNLSVFEQASRYNAGGLQDHEIGIRLAWFLFSKEDWDKRCAVLSGGEKMRLILCMLTIGHQAPDMIILDEPTNNLDIQNLGILAAAINGYQGTVLVVSHDVLFLEEIGISRRIELG